MRDRWLPPVYGTDNHTAARDTARLLVTALVHGETLKALETIADLDEAQAKDLAAALTVTASALVAAAADAFGSDVQDLWRRMALALAAVTRLEGE